MIRRPAVAFCLGSMIAAAAYADNTAWRQVAPQCAAQIAQQTHCASCNGYWPEVSLCAAQATIPGVNQQHVAECVRGVHLADARFQLAHDRVADVMRCLGQ
jgi:hypothetical protein